MTHDILLLASLALVHLLAVASPGPSTVLVIQAAAGSGRRAGLLAAFAMMVGALAWAAAVVPVLAFAGLTVVHALLPVLGRSPAGRSLYVHALHGFYFGAVADRVVDGLWGGSGRPTLEVEHG